MFRIGFDSATGKFLVQVRWCFLGLIPCWKTVCQQFDGPATAGPICCERDFETYCAASDWIDQIGLRNALSEDTTSWWMEQSVPRSLEA